VQSQGKEGGGVDPPGIPGRGREGVLERIVKKNTT
jgi:hypothetical protein